MAISRDKQRQLDRAVEARLTALYDTRPSNDLIRITRKAVGGADRHSRNVVGLWLLAFGVVIRRRPSLDMEARPTVDGLFDKSVDTPDVRAVRRAHTLLTRLVFQGCVRRGEFPLAEYVRRDGTPLPPGLVAYRASGGDLMPFYRTTDVVLADPTREPEPGQRVLLRDGVHYRLIFWPREGRPARRTVLGVVHGHVRPQ